MVQIFISYSQKDMTLINSIVAFLRKQGITPYVAAHDTPSGRPIPQKILEEIERSDALFVFWTRNVAENRTTSESVIWEVSSAQQARKRIYVFREKGVDVPMLVSYITDYFGFDPLSQDDLDTMNERMNVVANRLKRIDLIMKGALVIGIGALGAYGLWRLLRTKDEEEETDQLK
ncbi:hypothetical protein ES703_43288 [subsurface metagenome]